ncbi:ImmA/IrrE family metallo-endopeptidase [Paenibacillus sp. J2TS4]|uniref:ImmA/IrrE family metallo-endopeptidase n=1 Tax=Paenibacillus sp. J2TS4 TaxID=2807194 RepID=UPI001B1EAEE3|nr:ImmA/IrrE family metallo-endopeptidase [Paenibacillus sp. J2TS4]GIP35072.1 hypothetical protein J2TS4_42820 [Paenibacillus sp. J2TS4]
MKYEAIVREADQLGVAIYEKPMSPKTKGLYADNNICINRNIQTSIEKSCILAEELGHYHTSSGNILDQRTVENRKQEKRARSWAYERLVPLSAFIVAHRTGIRNRYELADYLGVTEDFLDASLKRYQEKFGISTTVGKYTIIFEPLGVLEFLE